MLNIGDIVMIKSWEEVKVGNSEVNILGEWIESKDSDYLFTKKMSNKLSNEIAMIVDKSEGSYSLYFLDGEVRRTIVNEFSDLKFSDYMLSKVNSSNEKFAFSKCTPVFVDCLVQIKDSDMVIGIDDEDEKTIKDGNLQGKIYIYKGYATLNGNTKIELQEIGGIGKIYFNSKGAINRLYEVNSSADSAIPNNNVVTIREVGSKNFKPMYNCEYSSKAKAWKITNTRELFKVGQKVHVMSREYIDRKYNKFDFGYDTLPTFVNDMFKYCGQTGNILEIQENSVRIKFDTIEKGEEYFFSKSIVSSIGCPDKIENKEEVKMDIFRKSDLKQGMVVEDVRGKRGLVLGGSILFDNGFEPLDNYTELLSNKNVDELDIRVIYIVKNESTIFGIGEKFYSVITNEVNLKMIKVLFDYNQFHELDPVFYSQDNQTFKKGYYSGVDAFGVPSVYINGDKKGSTIKCKFIEKRSI